MPDLSFRPTPTKGQLTRYTKLAPMQVSKSVPDLRTHTQAQGRSTRGAVKRLATALADRASEDGTLEYSLPSPSFQFPSPPATPSRASAKTSSRTKASLLPLSPVPIKVMAGGVPDSPAGATNWFAASPDPKPAWSEPRAATPEPYARHARNGEQEMIVQSLRARVESS